MASFRPSRSSMRSMIVATGALAFIAAATVLATTPPAAWEIDLLDAINGQPDTPSIVWWPVMQFGTLGAAAAVTAVLIVVHRHRLAVTFGVSAGLAWLVTLALKDIIGRPRPADLGIEVVIRGARAVGQGFPSGHSATAFAGAIVLGYALKGWWRVVPLVIAVAVGIARIYVGAHLPLDVVTGTGIGVFIGAVLDAAAHRPGIDAEPQTRG